MSAAQSPARTQATTAREASHDGVHDRATDRASETDRVYFAANPGAHWYARPMVPHELCGTVRPCLTRDDFDIVVVTQLGTGVRIGRPIRVDGRGARA